MAVDFGSIASSFASGLGQSLNAQPSTATGFQTAPFDSSGWNVNFGGGTIDSNREQSSAGNFDQYMPYALALVAVVIVYRLTRQAKK